MLATCENAVKTRNTEWLALIQNPKCMSHHLYSSLLYIIFPLQPRKLAASPGIEASNRGHQSGCRTLSKNSEFDRSRSASDLFAGQSAEASQSGRLWSQVVSMGHLVMGVKEP